jgi:uncharacterized protein (TIGR04255 family)
MGVKMKNAPIFYTIAQIQFNPILSMKKFVPDIQDQLRKEYPDFREERVNNLQIAVSVNQPQLQTRSSHRWLFIDQKRASGFILYPESLIFHTTAYETSESFFGSLMSGMEVVDRIAHLSYVEKVALRTLDAVVPEPGRSLEQYLSPRVLGFYKTFDGELQHNITECIMRIPPGGQLISRIVILKGRLGLPMELFPMALEVAPRFQHVNADHAILDIDRSEQERFKFTNSELHTRLQRVKQGATDAFRQSVLQQALEFWK